MLELDKRETGLAQAVADLVREAKTKAFGAAAIAEHEAERQAVIEAKEHLDKLRSGEGAYLQGTESLSEATGELMIVAAAPIVAAARALSKAPQDEFEDAYRLLLDACEATP